MNNTPMNAIQRRAAIVSRYNAIQRRAAIVSRYNAGVSIEQIADKYSLTIRSIVACLARAGEYQTVTSGRGVGSGNYCCMYCKTKYTNIFTLCVNCGAPAL